MNALAYSRKAVAAVIAHAASETTGAQHKEGAGGLVEQRANYFVRDVANLAAAAQKQLEPEAELGREALVMAQWAKQSAAAAAVQQMGLRFAAGSDALAALVRERQDLSAFWRERDKALIEALSKPQGQRNSTLIESIRKQIVDTESTLAANATRLATEFPDYAALASPKPLKAEEVQQLLGADEALVFFLTGDKESYVFALTRDGFDWRTIPLGAEALSAESHRISPRARCRSSRPRIGKGGVHAGRSGQARTVADGVRSGACEGVRAGRNGGPWPRAHRVQRGGTEPTRAVRPRPRARALRRAHRSGRGADQGQAPSHGGAFGRAHGAALSICW